MRELTERERQVTGDKKLSTDQKIIKLRQMSQVFWTYEALGKYFKVGKARVQDTIKKGSSSFKHQVL